MIPTKKEYTHWWENLTLKEILAIKPRNRTIEQVRPYEIKILYQEYMEKMSVNTKVFKRVRVKPILYYSRPIEGNITTLFYNKLLDCKEITVEVIKDRVFSDFNPDNKVIASHLKINYSIDL